MRRTITNKHGETLDYKFHKSATPRKLRKNERPHLLVIGHGVTGNLERPLVEALAKTASESGINVLRFSFSGNGESGGKFADANISKEVDDLQAVLAASEDSGFDVSYAGHSMGAAVGIIAAADDDQIKNLICLAPMIHTRRFADAEFGEVTPGKGNMWGLNGCRLTSSFMEDLKSIDTVLPRVSEIGIPLYIVHGSEDDVIPWAEAKAAYDFAIEPKQLVTIRGANHVFDFENTEGSAEVLMATTSTLWLLGRLGYAKPRKLQQATQPKKPRKVAKPKPVVKKTLKKTLAPAKKTSAKPAVKRGSAPAATTTKKTPPPKTKAAKKTKPATKSKPAPKKKAPAKKVAPKAKKPAPKKKAPAKKAAPKAKKPAPKKKAPAKKAAPKAKKPAPKKKAPAKKAAPKAKKPAPKKKAPAKKAAPKAKKPAPKKKAKK